MANMQMNKTPMPEQEPNIRNANWWCNKMRTVIKFNNMRR